MSKIIYTFKMASRSLADTLLIILLTIPGVAFADIINKQLSST